MAATGTIAFDSITITTLEADILGSTLTARAAFVNTNRGTTHGWTEGSGTIWSAETKAALVALVTSMETDMGKLHFTDNSISPSKEKGIQKALGGIAEHLKDDDAPSV